MWRSIFFLSLVIANAICNKNKIVQDAKSPDNQKKTLKFAFITVRAPSYVPNYYSIRHPFIPPSFSRLTTRGRYEAFDYGREIAHLYGRKFNIEKWNKTDYWSIAGHSLRSKQAAMILGAGLENKIYKVNRKWRERIVNETLFEAIKLYTHFQDKDKCPQYHEQFTVMFKKDFEKFSKEFPNFKNAMKIMQKKIINQPIKYYENPQFVWLAYESMYNLFYSYKSSYPRKFRYWRKVRAQLKEFSKKVLWTGLYGNELMHQVTSGHILNDIFNDNDKIIKGEPQPNAPEGIKNKISVLTVSQGVFAALVSAFAPNGTTIENNTFTASDLYPEHGAMHIIELYEKGQKAKKSKDKSENEWIIKILYRKKRSESLKVMKLPNKCQNQPTCKLADLKNATDFSNDRDMNTLCKTNGRVKKDTDKKGASEKRATPKLIK